MKKLLLLVSVLSLSGCQSAKYVNGSSKADAPSDTAVINLSDNRFFGTKLLSVNGETWYGRELIAKPGVIKMQVATLSRSFSGQNLDIEFEVQAGEHYEISGFDNWDIKTGEWTPTADKTTCNWRPVVSRYLKPGEPRKEGQKFQRIKLQKFKYGGCTYY